MAKTQSLRPSRVLRKIRAGQVAFSTKLNLADPRVADIAARCGFDCVWLDMEHVPNTWHDVENQLRAARMHDTDTIVRVARGSYSDLVRPLEMDADAIMVPHLMSAEDAKKVAYYTKFHPIGRRPVDGGNADGPYCMIPLAEYMRQANDQRFICVQIEDPEPMEELDAIAQVPGIDMLYFGPGDYSQGIGAPGEMGHPKIDEARRRVVAVARKHGKMAGTVASPANWRELAAIGYQFLNLGADVLALTAYFTQLMESAK